ncbi:uncharacterized protein [Diadema setosum]|uniref:uncharacterized protein isoform X1 n=1 Tax=Diadema setosum TaxID=31175 RepID=UPI003B3ABC9C
MNMHSNLRYVTVLLLVIGAIAFSEACEPNKKSAPTYTDGHLEVEVRKPGGMSRLRRSVIEESLDITPSPIDEIERDEAFARIDVNEDAMVCVIEWTLEGGRLGEFWALITDHDADGDEMISVSEFDEVPVKLIYA